VIISDARARLPRLLAAVAVAAGVIAWAAHLQAGLVLSHYDAKAHLVVARRVFDNITPGWQQIGAVWLPLPHLLNMLPAQVDAFYRTGAAASALSVASFGVWAWATARVVLGLTGSAAGAVAAVGSLALNPNVLYLQSTPMTEPLLLALSALVVLLLVEWVHDDSDRAPARVGVALAALAWTRYEGWAVVGAALAAATLAAWRRGTPPMTALRRAARVALWPAAAVIVFLINSRVTVGAWFVSGGFYVPDPTYQGQLGRTLLSIWWGTHRLSGYVLESVALATAAVLVWRALVRRTDAALLVPVALLAAAALPLSAFFAGHPYRIRYMIPLVGACAALAGIGVGLIDPFARRVGLARAGAVLAVVVVAAGVIESPPWAAGAPMLLEAQWDRPNSAGRARVTDCLARGYQGEKILASMGSLAHYMQELSRAGFDIADFINEGNGVIWELALETGPAPHAGWMLVEEQAEGGDVLAQRIRQRPHFADGMRRVCEGGGVALYRAEPAPTFPRSSPESQPDRERIRPSAEIDLGADELGRQVRLGRVIPHFSADREGIGGETDAAEGNRTGFVSIRHVALAEDAVVAEIDELAVFAVAPVEDAQPGADVRLDAVRLPERQDADSEAHRHEAQSQVLIDLGAVVIHEILVHGGDGAAVEADAGAGLEILPEWNQPLAGHRPAGEVAHVEHQEVAVLDERVAFDARIEATRDEAAEREVQGLLRRGGCGRERHAGAGEREDERELLDHAGSESTACASGSGEKPRCPVGGLSLVQVTPSCFENGTLGPRRAAAGAAGRSMR
jgi:hypothetical protein